jgi:hypothetical protein
MNIAKLIPLPLSLLLIAWLDPSTTRTLRPNNHRRPQKKFPGEGIWKISKKVPKSLKTTKIVQNSDVFENPEGGQGKVPMGKLQRIPDNFYRFSNDKKWSLYNYYNCSNTWETGDNCDNNYERSSIWFQTVFQAVDYSHHWFFFCQHFICF